MSAEVSIDIDVKIISNRVNILTNVLESIAAEGQFGMDELVFGLMGPTDGMGNWGLPSASFPNGSPPLLLPRLLEPEMVSSVHVTLPPRALSVSDLMHSTPELECRLCVWHSGYSCVVGIDNARTEPTRVQLIPVSNEFNCSQKYSGFVQFSFPSEVCVGNAWQADLLMNRHKPLPQCHIISTTSFRAINGQSKGPYLHLTFYPHRNDLPFDSEQWFQSLPSQERQAFRERNHTCRLRLTNATLIESSFANWSAFDGSAARARMGLAPLFISSTSDSQTERPATGRSGRPVPEPLRVVEPVREPTAKGIHDAATMVSWTVTFDLSLLTHHIPVIEFEGYSTGSGVSGEEAHRGSFCLLPDMFMLRDQTNGSSGVAAVSDDKKFVAPIYMNYAVVRPFRHPANSLRAIRSVESFQKLYFKTVMGHRGLGKTYTNSVATAKSLVQKLAENSIPSFVAAHNRGAGGVEFDVMLTSDRVPVVCHEPVFTVETTSAGGHHMEETEIYVHQTTKKQLDVLVKSAVPAESDSQCRLKRMVEHHWRSILEISKSRCLRSSAEVSDTIQSVAFLSDGEEAEKKLQKLIAFGTTPTTFKRETRRLNLIDQSPFISRTPSHRDKHIPLMIPTLAEVIENTPSSLSYNLEVKFPFQPKADRNLHLQSDNFEINRYCDLILEVLYRYIDQGREIGFSSFDPDICTALMLKQSRYHVLFLADCAERVDQKDYRSWGLEAPIQYASGERFAGVSIPSKSLLRSSDIETVVRNKITMKRYKAPSKTAQDDSSLQTIDVEYAKGIVSACNKRGLHVWTWGAANDNLAWCQQQKDLAGVTGVITDNIPPAKREFEI